MTDTPEPLTPADLRRLRDLFDQVADLDTHTRKAFLGDLSTSDPRLACELEALLVAHDSTGSHLASPIASGAVRRLIDAGDPWAGRRIGPYLVEQRIGAGGMGVVYRAVRDDEQFSKQVAIKFLRRSAESELALRRFRYERQILANLNHRNIAALLDGGTTESGDPWLVMELVEGEPITTWCRNRRATVRQRLSLFRQVCGAVQHAHQHLVVHRDLKPGNILVTADGTVKLLDFGIAKLLRNEEGSDQLPPTQGGGLAFTPTYAAPEQVRGLSVGTSADVYALGVVLFELLTGRPPFELEGKLLAEIEEAVCRTPPPRPSTLVSEQHAAACNTRISALRRRLQGDVDAITLTALRKEPERRFGSADALARDITLHLDGHPVTARADGLAYRAGKFVRRRKVELVAATVVATSLVAGIVISNRHAREAQQAGARATEIRDFLTTMLGAADPGALGRDVTVREVLDSASARADSATGSTDLRAEIQEVIGETYLALGEYETARDRFTNAVMLRRQVAPEGDRPLAQVLVKLSTAWTHLGHYPLADSILAEADAIFDRTATRDDPVHADILSSRAALQQELGDLATAEVLQREALEFRLRVTPGNDAMLANEYNDLGIVVGQQGRTTEAESLHVLAVAAARRAFGEEHPIVASTLSQHAFALEMDGRNAESDSLFRVAIAMRRKVLGPEHPDYAWSLFQYAQFLIRAGDWHGALVRGREVLELRGKTLPETHPAVSTALQVVGLALSNLDSLAPAERYLRESLELRRTAFGADHWLTASGESVLGEHLTRMGRYQEAERLLVAAESRLREVRGGEAPQTVDARRRLEALYLAWNRPAEAERWRALLSSES